MNRIATHIMAAAAGCLTGSAVSIVLGWRGEFRDLALLIFGLTGLPLVFEVGGDGKTRMIIFLAVLQLPVVALLLRRKWCTEASTLLTFAVLSHIGTNKLYGLIMG